MKIALCTELRNAEWFESRLRSLFAGDGQLVIDELWNEKQLSQALRRSRYHAVVIAMTGAKGLEAAIQAKRLAPETPLVWWSDDKNFRPDRVSPAYPCVSSGRLLRSGAI